MRLLPKKELDTAKAADRKREIDEGVKLATRVDTLRELQAKEEVGLEKWRTETVSGIQVEINSLLKTKTDLEISINEKQEEWRKLLEPLDKQWALFVKTEKANIERMLIEAEQKNLELQRKTQEVLRLQDEAVTEKNKLSQERKEVAENFSKAREMVAEAEVVASNAKNKAATILLNAELQQEVAIQRNTEAAVRETNVKLYEDSLKRKEDELETREMAALAKELLYYSPVKKN